MKILFLAVGDETIASSRTRVFQYLPYLQEYHIKSRVLIWLRPDLSRRTGYLYQGFTALTLLVLSLFYDMVFIQKVLLPRKYLRILKFLKRKMVFDFDDAVYTKHQSFENATNSLIMQEIQGRFQETISLVDLIVLENECTRQYAEQYNSNILMIPGPIDTVRYFPARKEGGKKIVIGWIGSSSTTMYLEPFHPVMQRLSKEYQHICFKTIGATPLELPGVNMQQVPWNLDTEVNELQEFDIGIMPLCDDPWSRGKGGYKLLQYMALGIPSVASPVGINALLIEDGMDGFLVEDEKEWYEKLVWLIENPDKRKEFGLKARRNAEERYSFVVAAPKLISELKKC